MARSLVSWYLSLVYLEYSLPDEKLSGMDSFLDIFQRATSFSILANTQIMIERLQSSMSFLTFAILPSFCYLLNNDVECKYPSVGSGRQSLSKEYTISLESK